MARKKKDYHRPIDLTLNQIKKRVDEIHDRIISKHPDWKDDKKPIVIGERLIVVELLGYWSQNWRYVVFHSKDGADKLAYIEAVLAAEECDIQNMSFRVHSALPYMNYLNLHQKPRIESIRYDVEEKDSVPPIKVEIVKDDKK